MTDEQLAEEAQELAIKYVLDKGGDTDESQLYGGQF